ncbi:N-acetylmuramic acid 6-phosphate etherase [Roseibium sp. TrichSKD4]|uniref:N-acetylmuramic acid 6-phosphate etherase n=1 Tax=Roseibium sp. TrichSKD4 TaxID=744980 RepID=UPI0001E5765F|nr:N-acetylmuramic acid 6-phosphate etherase [Roseibium sp. TrichSKD4]EFO30051.1 N-acetylmuramic acid 6-phosphate etherase [Roseibium sp. TrichSKD4]
MSLPRTELRDPDAIGLAKSSDENILGLLLEKQTEALNAVHSALPQLAKGASLIQKAIIEKRLIGYAGAGSAGLAALCDYLELPGTFGYPVDRLRMLFAGGIDNLKSMKGSIEDSLEGGTNDFAASGLSENDCLILISASGTTPYTLGVLNAAKAAGITTIGLANNPDTPLLHQSDVPILLQTQPEIIAGSTRLGAATAQKVALNMMSTLVALRLGHAVRGHMVNLVADNEKLQIRATRIIMDIAGCDIETAQFALKQTLGDVKVAILMVRDDLPVDIARQKIAECDGNLRPLLDISTTSDT